MNPLNLPVADLSIKTIDGKEHIFDILRKKHLVLTPEEWVRQHFVHLLLNQYKYPKSLFKIESGLKYNQRNKRSDILVFDRSGNPFLLVECKAHNVKVTQSAFDQAAVYNQTIKAPYLCAHN